MDEQPDRKTNPAIFVIAGLAIAVGLAALIYALTRAPSSAPPSAAIANQAEPATNTAEAATPAAGWTISSARPAVKVALLSELPSAPTSADGDCDSDYAARPESPAARAAVAKGWLIAREGRLGPLTAVVIVSSFEMGTGGFCYPNHGNLALFDGDRLVAIVYTPEGDNMQIAGFREVGSALRIASGGLGLPLGDLTLKDHALRVGPFPASEAVCGGRRRVPNIYGLTIAEARARLMANGWKPVPSTEEVEFFAADLRSRGIVEVEDCAPTGLGQCEFSYVAGRDTLGVVTIGDDEEMVTSYSAECH